MSLGVTRLVFFIAIQTYGVAVGACELQRLYDVQSVQFALSQRIRVPARVLVAVYRAAHVQFKCVATEKDGRDTVSDFDVISGFTRHTEQIGPSGKLLRGLEVDLEGVFAFHDGDCQQIVVATWLSC